VSDIPVLEPRLGDGPDHQTACHRPMAAGENLHDFRPDIDVSERIVEAAGSLLPDDVSSAVTDPVSARGEGSQP